MRSASCGPDDTSRCQALSATVVVSAPSDVASDPSGPGLGMRPNRDLQPNDRENAPGMRVEPPPSPAGPNGMIPAATAAAVPPEEPPGVRSTFHGLRVTPKIFGLVKDSVPNSGAAVLPTGTAPAARSRATCTESSATGPWSL